MTDAENAVCRFGFDPATIGLRHRGWWIIDEPDEDDARAGAKKGYLCVKARDGASNPPDTKAGLYPNYVGTTQDDYDCTYRYYYYSPLAEYSI